MLHIYLHSTQQNSRYDNSLLHNSLDQLKDNDMLIILYVQFK